MVLAFLSAAPVQAQPVPDDTRPLSPAQTLLFETPHLQSITAPGTLRYSFTREGGMTVSDTIGVRIRRVNADGTKDLQFEYLTGDRRVQWPELDRFRGNPLLMHTLDRDVAEMKEQVGVSVSYFRNKLRESFVTNATVTDTTFTVNGVAAPARAVTVQPFLTDQRLERIVSLQQKSYTFVLSDAVPGMLAEIRIAIPPDAAMQAPGMVQRTTFVGVEQ